MTPLLPLAIALAALSSAPVDDVAEGDVAFLLDAFEEHAGALLDQKDVDWRAVRREFTRAAREVADDDVDAQWLLGRRLVARLRDGHASMRLLKDDTEFERHPDQYGVGLVLVEVGGKLHVRNVFGPAEASGVKPGMEVLKVDGEKASRWFGAAVEELRDTTGFSTDHAARWAACTWCLTGDAGTTIKLELRKGRSGKKRTTLTFDKSGGRGRLVGPVVFPEDLEGFGRRSAWGRLPSGHGYVLLADVEGELPELLDPILAELADAPGIVLDFRGNRGGGCDHRAVFARFVPEGETLAGIPSAGPNPYTGPLVVLVDPATISAGETLSGQFKEDGRAYVVGPGPTHGMSGAKETVTVPSGLYSVRFVVRSHKGRFNGGRGVEGIGVPPHEVVPYDPKLLAEGVDPAIARAVELLEDGFPKGVVPYRPPEDD